MTESEYSVALGKVTMTDHEEIGELVFTTLSDADCEGGILASLAEAYYAEDPEAPFALADYFREHFPRGEEMAEYVLAEASQDVNRLVKYGA